MMSRSRRQRRCGGVIVGVVSLSGIIIAITIPITIIAVFVASEWEPGGQAFCVDAASVLAATAAAATAAAAVKSGGLRRRGGRATGEVHRADAAEV